MSAPAQVRPGVGTVPYVLDGVPTRIVVRDAGKSSARAECPCGAKWGVFVDFKPSLRFHYEHCDAARVLTDDGCEERRGR